MTGSKLARLILAVARFVAVVGTNLVLASVPHLWNNPLLWAWAASVVLITGVSERRVRGSETPPRERADWCRRFLTRDFSLPAGRDMSVKVLAAFDEAPREWKWRVLLFCSWWALECRGEVSVFLDDKITGLAEDFERINLPRSITESWHGLATALHTIQEAAHREQAGLLEKVL